VPRETRQEGLSTEQLLQAHHASNEEAAQKLVAARGLQGDAKAGMIQASAQTLEGARRQAHLSTILGMGMERDLGAALPAMAEAAPLTFAGREGYLMHRAQLKAITEPGTEAVQDNAEMIKRFGTMMRDITSSPLYVQDTAPMLFASGVAAYQAGSYDKLKAGGTERALAFEAHDGAQSQFDAFIVSPTFNRGQEPAVASLRGQITPAHSNIPDIGEVTTNRRILDQNRQPSSVEDYSLNGKGGRVPGTRNTAAVFATDVNNRESGVDVAPGLAFRRMAHEHLAAAGVQNPAAEVEKLYQRHMPSNTAHAAEVATFERHFDTAITKAAALKSAELAAGGDGQVFKGLADVARGASAVSSHAALIDARAGLDAERKPAEFKQILMRAASWPTHWPNGPRSHRPRTPTTKTALSTCH
jgi:hypothetical protein